MITFKSALLLIALFALVLACALGAALLAPPGA